MVHTVSGKDTGIANPLWNPWANDVKLLELYRRRCRQQTEEMTCAAQAAEILGAKMEDGETLLDAGCGGGYYYWSFQKRGRRVEYYGLDYTPEMIQLATAEMCPRAGLPRDRFLLRSIEHLDREFDNILCFNVLTINPHYALPLERLLRCARRRLLLRESLGPKLVVRYDRDRFLDKGKRHIRVYHNTYPLEEVVAFIKAFGFRARLVTDRRTNDRVEKVGDIAYRWRILLAERKRR